MVTISDEDHGGTGLGGFFERVDSGANASSNIGAAFARGEEGVFEEANMVDEVVVIVSGGDGGKCVMPEDDETNAVSLTSFDEADDLISSNSESIFETAFSNRLFHVAV